MRWDILCIYAFRLQSTDHTHCKVANEHVKDILKELLERVSNKDNFEATIDICVDKLPLSYIANVYCKRRQFSLATCLS